MFIVLALCWILRTVLVKTVEFSGSLFPLLRFVCAVLGIICSDGPLWGFETVSSSDFLWKMNQARKSIGQKKIKRFV